MSDAAPDLAELLDRYPCWQVEYQDHPPAWIATHRPAPAQVHVLAAYDLAGLRCPGPDPEALSGHIPETLQDHRDRAGVAGSHLARRGPPAVAP